MKKKKIPKILGWIIILILVVNVILLIKLTIFTPSVKTFTLKEYENSIINNQTNQNL